MERGGGSEEGAVMKVPPGPCGRADLLRSYERQKWVGKGGIGGCDNR